MAIPKDAGQPAVRILIVDDEEDICYFLSRNLSNRGYTIHFSHTLAEAELQLKREVPDILLLDNHLPDGKGVDFIHRVGQAYPSMKVVMITAHDSPQDRSRAYSNGISFFIPKPFTLSAVNQVVDLVVSNR
jgi:DNA-binding response OmpR family regulator